MALLLLTSVCSSSCKQKEIKEAHVFEIIEILLTAENHYDNPYKDVECWVELQGADFNKRINLKPGETKTVEFDLNAENLYIYNPKMEKVVEPGSFTVSVGSSSMEKDLNEIKLTVL